MVSKRKWKITTVWNNGNPTRNIWNNNGTYWIHYTIRKGNKVKRIRKSLKTSCVYRAMKLRDSFFKYILS